MDHTLFAWIGRTDLNAASGAPEAGLGPIGLAVKQRGFDRLELLSNYPSEQNKTYMAWLRRHFKGKANLHEIKLSSPTAFGEIYNSAVEIIEQIGDRRAKNRKWTFHLSPGTPAMASIWIILAKTRYGAELIESSSQGGVRTVSIPFEISAEFLPDLLARPDEELKRLSAGAPPESPDFADIIHRSRPMKELIAQARRAAIRNVPVLIEGKSGTGKELLARAIHRASPRSNRPFVAVNCGAIPSDLVASELFGHQRGAFTGAIRDQQGLFVAADDGTLFLDEIGELPLSAQVQLLRALQQGEVTPVGATRPRKVNVRVISATNRHLLGEVARGAFREDLFYRLAVFVLHIPALQDRPGDLGLLIDRILERLNRESATELGIEEKKLSPNARNLLLRHDWPGNVRELHNTLLRAAVMSTDERIDEADIRAALLLIPGSSAERILDRPLEEGFNLQEIIAEVARHYLQRAMKEANNNKSKAANLIGLPNYQTLTNWLQKYDVDPKRLKSD
jgi:DNA-binding NtrC family response regulator